MDAGRQPAWVLGWVGCGGLDGIFARVRFGRHIGGHLIELHESGPMDLRGAYHPLLLAQELQRCEGNLRVAKEAVVPFDLQLGGDYPGELYTPSARIYQSPAEPDYYFADRTVRVTKCGRIYIGKRKINLSIVFAGQPLGITQVDEQIWQVTFMQYDLG